MTINLLDSTHLNGEKYAIIELDLSNIHDIVNGLNTIVANKEKEIFDGGGDNQDKLQLDRFKQCLKEMQFVKSNVNK